MIIKITVRDSNCHNTMSAFCEHIADGNFVKSGPITIDMWLRDVLKKDYASSTEEERRKVIDLVKSAFDAFVDTKRFYGEDTAKYLKDNFECYIVPCIDDKWENREIFYVLPTSYEGKVLCF